MATQKKTHTTKKTTVKKPAAKKTAVKKGKAVVKARPLTWRFYVVAIGIFVIAVSTMIVIALFTSSIVAKYNNQARLDRINAIYTSLELGGDYKPVAGEVFGDKRPYLDDKSRTQASSLEFIHGDTVNNTTAELDNRIKSAGFTIIEDDSTPKDSIVRYYYKSAKNEYVKLFVTSKPYLDASQNWSIMDELTYNEKLNALDKNAGPAYVVIKVNLDDNNE